MDQNVDIGAPMVPATDNKQRSGKGSKVIVAISCVVAVCGIGFGIYGMIQGLQKDSQISDLKIQVEDFNDRITAIETPETETIEPISDSISSNSYSVFSVGMLKNFINKKITAVNDVEMFATITPDNRLEIHELDLVDNRLSSRTKMWLVYFM